MSAVRRWTCPIRTPESIGRGAVSTGSTLPCSRMLMDASCHPGCMRLSVLDQSPIPEGSTGAEALRNTLDLARSADRLGYHRYWVAEHHGGGMLAGPAPQVLIRPLASG